MFRVFFQIRFEYFLADTFLSIQAIINFSIWSQINFSFFEKNSVFLIFAAITDTAENFCYRKSKTIRLLFFKTGYCETILFLMHSP